MSAYGKKKQGVNPQIMEPHPTAHMDKEKRSWMGSNWRRNKDQWEKMAQKLHRQFAEGRK